MAVSGGYVTFKESTTSSSSFSFTSTSIGTAASDRYIVIGIARNLVLSGGFPTAVDLNGTASFTQVAADTGASTKGAFIWRSNAPFTTGSTATINVTFGGNALAVRVFVYAIYGIDPTPYATGGDNAASSGVLSMNTNTITDGIAIGVAAYDSNFSGGIQAVTWTGLTENQDSYLGSTFGASAASALTTSTQSPRTISAQETSGNYTDSASRGAVVSFGPPVVPGQPYQKRTGGVPFMGAKGSNKFGGGTVWMPERRLLLPERIAA